MKYFIANFKQNLISSQIDSWLTKFTNQSSSAPDSQVILSPSFPLLPLFNQQTDLSLAAQDVSPYDPGAHTGQVGADQLQDLVQFSLVGHSETRQPDDEKIVVKKVKRLLKHDIKPIVCLDEPYLKTQLKAFSDQSLATSTFIYAYEPLAAIGSGNPQEPHQANQVVRKIMELSQSQTVLYGGSVDSQNVANFTSQANINGVLVGSASLDPVEFAKIVSRE